MKRLYGVLFCLVNLVSTACCASSIAIGAISVTNPITALCGATLALSVVANKALHTWHSKASTTTQLPESVVLAERIYYESRKHEFDKIYSELLRIKKDIAAIKALCCMQSPSFTYYFLSTFYPELHAQVHAWLTISKAKELELNKTQQQELRLLRQHDLLVREQDIIRLQVALAVHSNELIAQVNAYCAEYRNMLLALNGAFESFQRGGLNATQVGHLYASLTMQEQMLDRLARKVHEACIIGEYYQRAAKTACCLAGSTTLIEKWQQVTACIKLNLAWIDQDKRTCGQRIAMVEQYFTKRGGNIGAQRNSIRKTVESCLNSCDAKILNTAMMLLETISQEATAGVALPQQEEAQKEEVRKIKTVEDLLVDAEPWTEQDFCKQFIKKGGYKEALEDFESLGLTDVRDMPGDKIGKIGVLPDGRIVNVRAESTAECPTVEILPRIKKSAKAIKIRYGQPKY